MPVTAAYRERNSDLINAILRVVIGAFLVYHGIEVFDSIKMKGYAEWIPNLSGISPLMVSYIGKTAELITGILLIAGLFVRFASVMMLLTFAFIAFRIGEGRIFMEEQHPFMFVLFAVLFLVEGGGRWSTDWYINNLRRDRRP